MSDWRASNGSCFGAEAGTELDVAMLPDNQRAQQREAWISREASETCTRIRKQDAGGLRLCVGWATRRRPGEVASEAEGRLSALPLGLSFAGADKEKSQWDGQPRQIRQCRRTMEIHSKEGDSRVRVRVRVCGQYL